MLAEVDAIAAGAGIGRGEEFDEAVHRFAGGAIHDDVDGGAEGGGDEFGVGTEKVGD